MAAIILGAYEFTSCGDGNGTIRFQNLPAGTYYIPVLNDPAYSASGPYTLNVTGVVCPPAPPNDDCEDVTPVVLTPGVPVAFNGTTTGATADCASFPGNNVWEAFTITSCANVTLDYCGTSPAYGNAWLNLAQGCPCVSFTSGGAFDTYTCGDGNVTITWSGLAAGTYYYPVMNDPAYGADGPYTIHVVANSVSSLCAAGSNMCDEYISNVNVGTINNASGCGAGGYTDFTSISTDMTQGLSYPITVTNGYPYTGDQAGIWIDWNGDFCFSADEQVTVAGNGGAGPYTGSINPPCDATPGTKLLRIRITYTGAVSPCGNTSYGEVEDYHINLLAAPFVPPTAVIVPNPQYAYYAFALTPMTDQFYVGNFGGGYLAQNVNLASVTVNGLTPSATTVIAGYTGIYCGALKISMPLATFLAPYGAFMDSTEVPFTVAGTFTDATPFSISGLVSLIGHSSVNPGQFIVPPQVVVLPGDFDASGMVDISDPVAIVGYIFAGQQGPANILMGDVDCSASVDISDVVFMIQYIFSGGPAPCHP